MNFFHRKHLEYGHTTLICSHELESHNKGLCKHVAEANTNWLTNSLQQPWILSSLMPYKWCFMISQIFPNEGGKSWGKYWPVREIIKMKILQPVHNQFCCVALCTVVTALLQKYCTWILQSRLTVSSQGKNINSPKPYTQRNFLLFVQVV